MGGADADIIRDDTVVEVKTVKIQTLLLGIVRQLVGYALLANAYGTGGTRRRRKITKLGVYFSRAGLLHTFRLADAIDAADHSRVLRFLTGRGAR